MSEVLNLRINTGRSDVYYPSLKPIIVQTSVNIDVVIDVDPDTQEVTVAISDISGISPTTIPFVTSPNYTAISLLVFNSGVMSQIAAGIVRATLYTAGNNLTINSTTGEITATVPDGQLLGGTAGNYLPISVDNSTLQISEQTLAAIPGNLHGVADAVKLTHTFNLAISGAANGAADIDGSANVELDLVLANSGVSPGDYNHFTVNSKGLITAADSVAYLTIDTAGDTYLPLAGGTITGDLIVDGVFNAADSTISVNPNAVLINPIDFLSLTSPVIALGDAASTVSLSINSSSGIALNYGDIHLNLSVDAILLNSQFGGIVLHPNQSLLFYNNNSVTVTDTDIQLNTTVNFLGHTASNLRDPVNFQDAATKNYVDLAIQGLNPKPSANFATTGALPANTYDNANDGTDATLIGNSNGALSIDDGTPAIGQLILVKNEANAAHNGLYLVDNPGDAGTPYHLTRSIDMDTASEFSGALIAVENGTVNRNTLWLANFSGTFVTGTTNLNFANLTAANAYIFGTGLNFIGSTITVAYGLIAGTALQGNLFAAANGVATLDGNGKLTVSQLPTINITGDVSGSGTNSISLTLANSGVTASSYNTVTVNAKGLVTGGSNVAYLTGNQSINITGDASGSGTTAITLTLADTAVTPGSYSKLTVNSKGLITGGTLATLAGDLSDVVITSIADKQMLAYDIGSGKYINISPPYDMAGYFPTAPTNGQTLGRIPLPRPVTFPQNLTNSVAVCVTAPTGAVTLPIKKNGVSQGTINFALGASTATFTLAAPLVFASGDVLEIDGPSPADSTLAGISWVLVATRS